MMRLQNYEIEYAQTEDLPAIVNIYNSTILGRVVTADLEPVSVESRRSWFFEHNDHHRPLWVMRLEGKVIAWMSFQSFYGRAAYDGTAEISIYVSEDYRGAGVGSILIEKAIVECSRLNIDNLVGFVFAHNEGSLKLLTKYGFKQWGYLPEVAVLDNVKRNLVIVGLNVFGRS
ncbi:GNAT family N-acetyltransferase [Paenibacillus crassostreae]|uniref:Phosphinothricin acetyltransferase n=1 Tax=Paenibacillus crassostreae TaxID=1763538 RepID=A0A167GI49_9BACL|nr:GNAT family N-acetyltransferase [Paenibacillus crassostreae]AOZ92132.1 N-acetyltransferase [Paenibacillus crassostreae]OAB77593.1 phosphinothricin acetyltransferase [Paenibacillus crassostreae]